MGHWMTDVNGDDYYVQDKGYWTGDVNGDECYVNPGEINIVQESIVFDWMENHEDAMIKHGWYRVVDVDKKSVCIGDKVDKVDSDYHRNGTVVGIEFYEQADGSIRTLIAVRFSDYGITSTWYRPNKCRHHKPITVEDVLHDFICDHEEGIRDEADIIAQYAKKLQLAGDAK